jgi:hypothetical protein
MIDSSDRRAEKRVWLKMPLTIGQENGRTPSPTAFGETINVSRHGACLIADSNLGIGDALTLFLFGSDNPKTISGRVTWQDPVGVRQRIGVRFDAEPADWIIA